MNRPTAGTAWLLLTALALGYGLGGYALMDPDEGRNAVIAQGMAGGGGWLVPHLNGLPFLDKPFLLFAVTAAAIRVFGDSEWALRLPPLLSTWATLALVVWFSRRLFGRDAAWVAGTAFATSLLTIIYARTLIFDATLTFFVTLALVAFYLAVEDEREPDQGNRSRFWHLLAWAAVAGGTFTKGPVALLIPLLVAVPFALWRRRIAAVFHPFGLLLFFALVVPWIAATERAVPGFLHYSLVTETWERLTTDKMQRTGPLWYFLPITLGGTFPWSVLPFSVGRSRLRAAMSDARRPGLVFLALWLALPLIFFSLSQSKRVGYVLPLVPAVALLAGWAWSNASSRRRGGRIAAAGWLVMGAVLLTVGRDFTPKEAAAKHLTTLIPSTALALGLVMVLTAIVAWLIADRRRLAPIVLSLPLIALPVITAPLLAEVAEIRSGRAMAAAAEPSLAEATTIVGVATYSGSLAFYLERPISLSTADGAPLSSNYAMHLYPDVVGVDGSPLQPEGAWRSSLAACSQPTLFLLKTRYENRRAALSAAGLPVLFAGGRHTLMGPCRSPGSSHDPTQDGEAPPGPGLESLR